MNLPAFDDFGDPERSPRADKLARIAHWSPIILLVTLAVRIVTWFAVDLPWPIITTSEVLMFGTYLILVTHQRVARICLRCMEDVKPDAPLRAQRKSGVLRVWHASTERRYLWFWVGLVLATIVIQTLLIKIGWGGGSGAVRIPMDLLWGLYLYSVLFHHRVSPWCPYCRRWDEGGDHEVTPTPDPTATKVA